MLYIGVVVAVLLVALALRFWATRGDETIDLRSSEARQSAAASFLIEGHPEEAERMLRQAVAVLEAWDKALALADYASFLAATDRDAEAASALEEALGLAKESAAAPAAEVLEMRVQMAQAYSRQGHIQKARSVLVKSVEEEAGDELGLGLAEEAYAEFLVRHGELELALQCYERACKRLATADHDRAPIAVTRYAHALLLDAKEDSWRAMDALSEELQHAVPVALEHLAPTFEVEESLQLAETLLEKIGSCGHWQEERDSLNALVRSLSAAD